VPRITTLLKPGTPADPAPLDALWARLALDSLRALLALHALSTRRAIEAGNPLRTGWPLQSAGRQDLPYEALADSPGRLFLLARSARQVVPSRSTVSLAR
jgi:hypothetical protein